MNNLIFCKIYYKIYYDKNVKFMNKLFKNFYIISVYIIL